MEAISGRQLAVSISGYYAAAGEFEKKVHIWDLSNNNHVCSFETVLDFGGHRLAISTDGQCCIAGAYHVHGIMCYSTKEGKEIWYRKDLKKPQFIRFSQDDTRVIVGIEGSSCHILDRYTGNTLKKLHGVKKIYEGPFQQILLRGKNKQMELAKYEGEKIAAIPRTTFAELDVAFSPRHVCVSESAGPIRCCDIDTGQEKWKYREKGRHVLYLSYHSLNKSFLGVDWAYENGGSQRLLHFDEDSGLCHIVSEFDPRQEMAFCLNGTKLLTADGMIFDAANGKLSGKIIK
jgi:WD40 repeat protein